MSVIESRPLFGVLRAVRHDNELEPLTLIISLVNSA